MFTEKEIKDAKQLLNDIIHSDHRFEMFNEDRDYQLRNRIERDKVYTELEDRFTDDNIHFSFGATRMVIIVDDKYVLKTNLYEPEYSEWGVYYTDYCDREYQAYREALKAEFADDLKDCFAECIKIIDNGIYSWYMMEYCEPDDDLVSDIGSSYYTDEEREDWDFDCHDPEVTYNFLAGVWGSDLFGIFDDFRFDHDIRDLHTANIGKTKYGWWKVFDYASYFG